MNLDAAADELYGSSLDDFVGERTRLAKALRGAGKQDDAAALAALRKPTVAAWVLNQLARRNRRDVDLLLDSGHRLREAQAGALSGGDREGFERARKAQHDALRRLRSDAEQLLKSERRGASASVLNQVEEALRAAAISEPGREALARGRFAEPPRAEGFDVVTALAPAPTGQAPARRRRAGADELRAATAKLTQARESARDAEQVALEAEREAGRIRRAAEAAQGEATRARARAKRAAQALADAEERVEKAKRG
jgi:hypothetical protein